MTVVVSGVLMMVLAACGGFGVVPTTDISAGFDPTAFGFEIDDEGEITVASHIVSFTARAGSTGATVVGYRIEFFDKDGNPHIVNDSVSQASDALNADVPPGILCDELLANPLFRCTVNDTNVRFQPSQPVFVSNFISLDAPMVQSILELYQVGDYANVYFYVENDLNREFVTKPLQVALVFPVNAGG